MFYGDSQTYESGNVAFQTQDGGFVACGYAYDSLSKCFLIKTDSNGILQWGKEIYDQTALYGSKASFISQTADNGFIISGTTIDSNSSVSLDNDNSLLIKIDSAGNTQWFRKYNSILYDQIRNVYQTADGGYIIAGVVDTLNDSLVNPFQLLTKTDSNGIVLWAKAYGNNFAFNQYYYMATLIPVSDGTYNMLGIVNALYNNIFSLKTDSIGNYLWSKTYGHVDTNFGLEMVETTDRGFFISGLQFGSGTLSYDESCLIKTDSAGNSFCNDSMVSIFTNNINFPLLPTTYIETTHDSFSFALPGDTSYSMSLNTICSSVGVNEFSFVNERSFNLFPNPATDVITIHYNLPSPQQTTISLFNIYGQKIKTIYNEKQPAGEHEIKTDMKDVAAGIYFVKMNAGGREEVRKVMKF